MKKFIEFFTVLIFSAFFLITIGHYDVKSQQELLEASQKYFQYEFKIPNNSLNNPECLELLKKAAELHQVNLIRRVEYYNEEEKVSEYEDYLYLSKRSDLFNKIDIREGRELNLEDMLKEDVFLSTETTALPNQIGVIRDFFKVNPYTIYVFDHLLTQVEYSGVYRAECDSEEIFEAFIQEYINYFRQYQLSDIDEEEIILKLDSIKVNSVEDSTLIVAFSSLFTLLFLSYIFYLVYKTKVISIMKMNGFEIKNIQKEILLYPFLKIFFLINFIFTLVSLFIHDTKADYIIEFLGFSFLFLFLIILFIGIISKFYIKSVQVTHSVKGKKPISIVLYGNIGLKIILSTISLIISLSLFQQLHVMILQKGNLENWSKAASYGVFAPVRAGDDSGSSTTLDISAYNFYPFLNKEMKAIYINAYEYTEDMIEANPSPHQLRLLKVNPNYLNEFPIYDVNNERIMIDEEIDYYIYLVPEKYKESEVLLKEFLQNFRNSYHEIHEDFYGQIPHPDSREIVFIYTKNNQQIFSMNEQVYPNLGNYIEDPIIGVVTEGNRLVPDCHYATSLIQNLFVPLLDGDTELTYEKMLPQILQNSLDDNFKYFVKKNEVILEQINQLQTEIDIYIKAIILNLMVLMIVLSQYIYLIFQKNKYDLFLKRIFGHNFYQRYNKIYFVILMTNIIEGSICYIQGFNFNLVFLFKVLIEISLISILIIYFELFNHRSILKERR